MAALIDPGLRAQLDVAAGSVSVLGLLLDCPKGSLFPAAVQLCLQAGSRVMLEPHSFSAACWLGRSSKAPEFACAFLAFISGACCLHPRAAERVVGAPVSAGLHRSCARGCGWLSNPELRNSTAMLLRPDTAFTLLCLLAYEERSLLSSPLAGPCQ